MTFESFNKLVSKYLSKREAPLHILIPVFFKAAHGGLHENILATARHLIISGHSATIVCPPGSFSDSLAEYGIGVVRTNYANYDDLLQSVLDLHRQRPISLVHAHPFASRKFGLVVAERLNIPFVLTIHGKYTDDLSSYESKVATVLTVSSVIRDYLLQESQISPERMVNIPNVPDQKLFSPRESSGEVEREGSSEKIRISLVSRLDQDKQFILDVFSDAVEYASSQFSGLIDWIVVGDGTQSEKFQLRLDKVRGENPVSFVGWLEGQELRDAYRSSSCVIAPGRCAIEAMACAVPVIAVGSKGYTGLVCDENWQTGVYTNFGGVGNKHSEYCPEDVQKDLYRVLASATYR
ncbi:glycosyltransferase [Orrella marina]|uniref:Group 1 glycosyl transferase n=1 Tax=Orrella marina TaxID=2163011 RepID=A0A2R4XFG7_9BURK|nr:glycosyltransferase [Orrella marina]AWB32552.1 group 1 glycosyl transferase [Orrella marina]